MSQDETKDGNQDNKSRPRVTGLGGIFFKVDDPAATREWYAKNLGLDASEYGATFEWRLPDRPDVKGQTVWNPFKATTKYFEPSAQPFMVNYRVNDLLGLLAQLKEQGIEPVGEVQVYDYGKFAHIMDPDGNKLELWEAADETFAELQSKTT